MPFAERLALFAVEPDECWNWPGCVGRTGYGKTRVVIDGEVFLSPHRAAYRLLVGPIPKGLSLDHLCRNPRCMNPHHLEPVTHRENVLRGESFAAANAKRDQCVRGHPLMPRTNGSGRFCPICVRATKLRYKKRHPEKTRAANREWASRPEVRERRNAQWRSHYTPGRDVARCLEWQARNPEKVKAARRARYLRDRERLRNESAT